MPSSRERLVAIALAWTLRSLRRRRGLTQGTRPAHGRLRGRSCSVGARGAIGHLRARVRCGAPDGSPGRGSRGRPSIAPQMNDDGTLYGIWCTVSGGVPGYRSVGEEQGADRVVRLSRRGGSCREALPRVGGAVVDDQFHLHREGIRWPLKNTSKLCHRHNGIVARSESGSDRVRRARHRVESVQMASLSWRHYSLVRAVVPPVPDLICAHGRDGARTWSADSL
jgi:hypothetical protein